jgi:hypothetical protein
MPSDALPIRQKIAAIALALLVLIVVVDLVRKRKLREEYSFLWIGTAVLLMVMALWTDVLVWFQRLLDADKPESALWFGAFVFLMLVVLQYSIRLSKMAFREKAIVQRIALLEKEVDDLRKQLGAKDGLAAGPEEQREQRHPAKPVATGRE